MFARFFIDRPIFSAVLSIVLSVAGGVAILVLPIAAVLLQLGVSRQREYLADATAARTLGRGGDLADALETLERGTLTTPLPVNPATASLYIADPLAALKGRGFAGLFATHPPIAERVRRLRAYDGASA